MRCAFPLSRFFLSHASLLLAAGFVGLTPLRAAATKGSPDLLTNLKQKALQEAVGTLLDQQLPLKLDASTLFPTVKALPGTGPFVPTRFTVTAENWDQPMPPGDYVVRAVAFCSEYSVHRSGAGTAYVIGPIQGQAGDAIATLLWRGTVVKRRPPHDLQKVSWAIQAGVTYARMPRSYQAVVDDVIPDLRGRLGGDFVENLQNLYTARAKEVGLPPLNTLLAQLGKPGELVISANRQRAVLLRQDTSEQRRDQILFAGQERRIAPVRASEGPWTEKIPGVAYVRYRVVGGNGRANNEIQIRVLPPAATKVGAVMPATRGVFGALAPEGGRVAAAAAPKPRRPSLYELTSDGIGYCEARAAQVLFFAPVPGLGGPGKDSGAVGRVTKLEGAVNVTRNGETRALKKNDEVRMDDTLSSENGGKAHVTFDDQSTLSLGENATVNIDQHLYDPANPDANTSSYNWLQGAFVYTSGLLGVKDKDNREITTRYGDIGIRGTEFFARYVPNTEAVEIHLIAGSLILSPRETMTSTVVNAPVSVQFTATGVTTRPLTRRAYNGQALPILVR